MGKFHMTPEGPRPCTASERPCRYGAPEEHYPTREAAQRAFEGAQDPLPATTRRTLPATTVTTRVKPFAGGRYQGCEVSSATVEPFEAAVRERVGEERWRELEAAKEQRDRGRVHHLTVVTPPEQKAAGGSLPPPPERVTLTYHGVGWAEDQGSEAYFVVCSSPEVAAWRERAGLPPKDLHITLGFSPKDVHTRPKGLTSLVAV